MTAAAALLPAERRTLEALDRISSVAFESRRVDDLLHRLLEAIVEPTASVDTGSILLRDGDDLVVRAAVGLEEELHGEGLRVRIGEGFSGRIASERRPRLLVGDAIDGEVASPVLRARGLRAVYGVPLESDGQVLGVAHIGSITASGFSEQERWLFEAMCARAAACIRMHLLREEAATQARELETVLQSIPDAVFVADARSVHHANRAALDMLGVDSVAQLNRASLSLSEVIEARHPDTGEPLAPHERPIPRALGGETVAFEMTVRHQRTGEDVVLLCTAAPVSSGGRTVGAALTCTDITERKSKDAEGERLYREARQAVADRQHVLSVVSHDLRNPLNTIVLAAAALTGERTPEMTAKGLGAITRAAARMNRMISDLLDVSSVESGRLAIHALPVDPHSVVAEVCDLFEDQAAARGLILVSDVPAVLPMIRADRHRLVQALANLVSNALKVTPEGPIVIRAERRPSEVVFSVADSGPGIVPGTQDHLFDPYWRQAGATYKGTGLGLAIVRGVVEGHGGQVWVESEPGQGATFLFTIPVA